MKKMILFAVIFVSICVLANNNYAQQTTTTADPVIAAHFKDFDVEDADVEDSWSLNQFRAIINRYAVTMNGPTLRNLKAKDANLQADIKTLQEQVATLKKEVDLLKSNSARVDALELTVNGNTTTPGLVQRIKIVEDQYAGVKALAEAMPTQNCSGKTEFIPVASKQFVVDSVATAKSEGITEGKTYVDEKVNEVQTKTDANIASVQATTDKKIKEVGDKVITAQKTATAAQETANNAENLAGVANQKADAASRAVVALAFNKKDRALAEVYASYYKGNDVKGFRAILPKADNDKLIQKLHAIAIACNLIPSQSVVSISSETIDENEE